MLCKEAAERNISEILTFLDVLGEKFNIFAARENSVGPTEVFLQSGNKL